MIVSFCPFLSLSLSLWSVQLAENVTYNTLLCVLISVVKVLGRVHIPVGSTAICAGICQNHSDESQRFTCISLMEGVLHIRKERNLEDNFYFIFFPNVYPLYLHVRTKNLVLATPSPSHYFEMIPISRHVEMSVVSFVHVYVRTAVLLYVHKNF